MANLLSKQMCPKTDHLSEKHDMQGTNLKWMPLPVNNKGSTLYAKKAEKWILKLPVILMMSYR